MPKGLMFVLCTCLVLAAASPDRAVLTSAEVKPQLEQMLVDMTALRAKYVSPDAAIAKFRSDCVSPGNGQVVDGNACRFYIHNVFDSYAEVKRQILIDQYAIVGQCYRLTDATGCEDVLTAFCKFNDRQAQDDEKKVADAISAFVSPPSADPVWSMLPPDM